MRISDWSSDVCSSDLEIASTIRVANASSRNTPTARSTRFFDVLMVCPLLEKCRRKNEVEYQHQQRAIDHVAGGGNRRALDGGFGMEAGVGCHQRTNQAKHRAFDECDDEIIDEIDTDLECRPEISRIEPQHVDLLEIPRDNGEATKKAAQHRQERGKAKSREKE